MYSMSADLKNGRCPRCGKSYTYASVAAHKPFPFCSARCREVDLGLWLTGAYQISTPLQPQDLENDPEAADKAPPTSDEDAT